MWSRISTRSMVGLQHELEHGKAFMSTLEPGAPVRYVMDDADAVEGVVEVAEPPHRLVTTWRFLHDPTMAAEPPSRVEWLVSKAGENLTLLRVEHGDLARSPVTWGYVKDGWVWVLDGMKTLLETGEPLPPNDAEAPPTIDAEEAAGDWHRAQAIEANNSTWELIDKADRTADDDEDMLRRAYAAVYHWSRATGRGPEHAARGAWLQSKVQLLVGQPELALSYADRCMTICTEHGLADFDLAYAHEARARALKALGRDDESAAAWQAANTVPIADPEDRAILEADLSITP